MQVNTYAFREFLMQSLKFGDETSRMNAVGLVILEERKTFTPVMTSDSQAGYQIMAPAGGYVMFSQDISVGNKFTVGIGNSVTIKFAAQKYIYGIGINIDGCGSNTPKDFTVAVSNDNISYTTIGTFSNVTDWSYLQYDNYKRFNFDITVSKYQYVKITFAASNSSDIEINEIAIYDFNEDKTISKNIDGLKIITPASFSEHLTNQLIGNVSYLNNNGKDITIKEMCLLSLDDKSNATNFNELSLSPMTANSQFGYVADDYTAFDGSIASTTNGGGQVLKYSTVCNAARVYTIPAFNASKMYLLGSNDSTIVTDGTWVSLQGNGQSGAWSTAPSVWYDIEVPQDKINCYKAYKYNYVTNPYIYEAKIGWCGKVLAKISMNVKVLNGNSFNFMSRFSIT